LASPTKNQEKKGRPLKCFFQRSKRQAGSSKNDYQTQSHLIRALTRPKPTIACSGQLAVHHACDKCINGGGEAAEGGTVHWILYGAYHCKGYLAFWNIGRRISFFSWFLLRGPIRKSRTWRSAARESKKLC
jgi:hypothetical protein